MGTVSGVVLPPGRGAQEGAAAAHLTMCRSSLPPRSDTPCPMSCSVHGDSVLGPPPLTGLTGHPHPGSHVLPPAPGSEHHHWHLSHAPRTRGAWGIFLDIQAMCACNLGLRVSHHGRLALLAPWSSLHTRMVQPWLLNKVATDSPAGRLPERTGSLRGRGDTHFPFLLASHCENSPKTKPFLLQRNLPFVDSDCPGRWGL